MKKLFFTILCSFLMTGVFAQNASTKANATKMEWWKAAKFGMFIHWGIYSVPAGQYGDHTDWGEWIMIKAHISRKEYRGFAAQFNPTKFDADAWVKLAKDAGQKYIVITAKHHDGFAMYKSYVSDYNVVDATPFKRDVLKELAEACRKYGIKLGIYYSQSQDWYHPGGATVGEKEWDPTHAGTMKSYVDSIAIPQVREILKNYPDVAILWWDMPENMTKEMCQDLVNELKPYPNLITNDRLGAGTGGDITTPEQHIPATGYPNRNWEVCMTMNGNWGYNAYDEHWKSTKALLQKLVDIVSKGGNFLLNVGPNKYGEIPQICQDNLHEIGDWMNLNGESIYGTTASPFGFLPFGRATRKGQTIYLHVFDWPADRTLNIPLNNKITSAYLLADKSDPLKVTHHGHANTIHLPAYTPDKTDAVIAIKFEGQPQVLPVPTLDKDVKVSSVDSASTAKHLTDGNPNTEWKAKKGESKATLEIDLGRAYSIYGMSLVEPFGPYSHAVQTHELQYWNGTNWVSIIKSTTDGNGSTEAFKAVQAQKFRLLLDNEKSAPRMSQWLLYRSE